MLKLEERLYEELEVLKTDLAAALKQLDGKSQAVLILNEALEQCKKERNEFKKMAEQVMNRYQLLKKTLNLENQTDTLVNKELTNLSVKQLSSMIVESREANKSLQQELVELRTKLNEAHGDITVLRQQLKETASKTTSLINRKLSTDDRHTLVLQLEELSIQAVELRRELERSMDEKEEIATERDIYRNKCDRLNNELNYILNGDERKLVDIDALITQNRTLQQRLQLVENEKSLAMTTLSKYKKLVERKTSKTSSTSSECALTPFHSPKHKANEPDPDEQPTIGEDQYPFSPTNGTHSVHSVDDELPTLISEIRASD